MNDGFPVENFKAEDPVGKTRISSHKVRFDADNRPYSLQFGDHFYSSSGGRGECVHVFLNGNQLPGRWKGADHFTIGELGFGSGLNFLETWHHWIRYRQAGQLLHFVSFEFCPLTMKDLCRVLATFGELEPLGRKLVAALRADNGSAMMLDQQTRLTLIVGDCRETLSDWQGCADAWYLDGFSPAKNPEMWEPALLDQVFQHTLSGGTFATYTSAGRVRENLRKSGFIVQRVTGFGQKRHMSIGYRELIALSGSPGDR